MPDIEQGICVAMLFYCLVNGSWAQCTYSSQTSWLSIDYFWVPPFMREEWDSLATLLFVCSTIWRLCLIFITGFLPLLSMIFSTSLTSQVGSFIKWLNPCGKKGVLEIAQQRSHRQGVSLCLKHVCRATWLNSLILPKVRLTAFPTTRIYQSLSLKCGLLDW